MLGGLRFKIRDAAYGLRTYALPARLTQPRPRRHPHFCSGACARRLPLRVSAFV